MKKIIALIMSLMMVFSFTAFAFAKNEPSDDIISTSITKPTDPRIEEKDPAATPDEPVTEDSTDPIMEVPTTGAPLTTAPVIIEEETDISIPDTMDETPLDALYKAFLNLITGITEIRYGITVDIYDIIFNLF